MKQIYLLIAIILITLPLRAQDPVHRVINNLNGLPCNTVYNLKQDNNGFIWIAHDRGLSRYDGKRFVHYSGKEQQGKALSNLLEYNNSIYCQDFSGNFYHTTTARRLVKVNALQARGYMPAGILQGGILAAPAGKDLRLLNLNTGTQKVVMVPSVFSSGISYNEQGVEAIVTSGIIQYKNGKLSTTPFTKGVSGERFFYFIKSKGRSFVFTKYTTPHIYELHKGAVKPIPFFPENTFIQNVQWAGGYIWVATSSGAYCFTPDMHPAFNGHCFFKDASISNIIADNEGNFWFGTLNKGLIMAMTLEARVYPYHNRIITALFKKDDHTLYAGTDANQLLSFNTNTGVFDSITGSETRHEIINIQEPYPGALYFFSDKTYVRINNSSRLTVIPFSGKSVTKLPGNLLALAYSNGTALMTPDFKAPQVPDWLPVSEPLNGVKGYSMFTKPVRCKSVLYAHDAHIFYTTTADGLHYFSPGSRGLVMADDKPIMGSQLCKASGGIYVATLNSGLYKIEGTRVVKQLTVKDGLLGNSIYRIRAQGNSVWMLMEDGIQCYDTASERFTTFLTSDCISRADLRDIMPVGNRLYVATSEGLLVFNTGLNTHNTVPPVLHINGFSVNGKLVNYSSDIQLPHTSNTVDIDYAALAYRGEDAVRVQYSINNGRWSTLTERSGRLNLPYLSDGSYKVALRAFNEDGVVTPQPVVFLFSIQAPFYKRWWFVLLCVAGILCVIWLYYRKRILDIKAKNYLITQKLKLEQELQQSVLSTVRSQMNPHFLFNALNTIQSYIYTNEREQASLYLGKFSELTRLILELSGKELVPLSEELRALTLYVELEKQRFEDSFSYLIDVEQDISTETVYVPPMLIQPYVENAMKHGLLHKKNNRKLRLSLKKTANGIIAEIEDNGIGRKRSEELNSLRMKSHRSFATYANHKRLEILNRGFPETISLEIVDLYTASGEACGTLVRLHIPVLYPDSKV